MAAPGQGSRPGASQVSHTTRAEVTYTTADHRSPVTPQTTTILCRMAILPIVIVGDPVLHQPTQPVTQPLSEIAELVGDMYDTMDAANGVGLAANQVGVALRLFVYDCPDYDADPKDGARRRGEVINPVLETSEIPETMPDPDDDEEGCLSVPGEQFPTGRANWAKVTGVDRNGDPVTIEGTGFFARMLQHEVGHLDGFLYTDMLIGRYKRAAKKIIKRSGWGVPGLDWTPGTVEDPFGHDE
ncbi:Peptide deformylase [Rhodococcus sp. RD6.2]|nr:Peptide deformylase [Rhodococcus sp. RD6.2]